MKKFITPFLFLYLLSATVSGNVDIVAIDGIPYVTWCYDRAYIAACPSGVVSDPVSFGETGFGSFRHASICHSTPAAGDRLIIGCSTEWIELLVDTVYLLEPENLNVLNQRSLSVMDLGFYLGKGIEELHLPRYCDGSDSFAVVASIGDYTTDAGVFLASASLGYPDVGSMLLSDTLMVNIGYGWGPPDLLGPVVLPGLNPLSLSCHGVYNPVYYEGYILSHLHQEEPGIMDNIGDMYTHFIWSTNSEGSYDFSISALGSSSSEAVGLWTDSAGVRFYSVFVDSIAPSYTYVFPFPYPTPSEPAAMTRNPSDSGLLLAWYHGGEISVRHWESEWNDFDHIVASGQPSVSTGNIAVCSVDDGYWLAWLSDGADQPVLEYVDRGLVTGIQVHDEDLPSAPFLLSSQNPFTESVNLTLKGYPLPEVIEVFDITGRLIRVLRNDSIGNTFLWNGRNASGQEVPSGTYFIRAESTGDHALLALVKL